MADAEVLIRIKKILETEGADKAQAEIRKLVEAETDAAKGANQQAGETNKLQSQLGNLQRTTQGVSQAMRGGEGAMQGASNAARGLSEMVGGKLAQAFVMAGAAAAAARAGFAIGTALDQWLGLSDKISNAIVPAQKFGDSIKKTREEMRKLSETRMDALAAELKALASSFDKLNSELDRSAARQAKIREADQEKRKTEIEAMPEGTWQEKAAKQKEMAKFEAASSREDLSGALGLAEAKRSGAIKQQESIGDRKWALESAVGDGELGMASARQSGDVGAMRKARAEFARAQAEYNKFLEEMPKLLEEARNVQLDAEAEIEATKTRQSAVPIRQGTSMGKISRDEVQAFAESKSNREKSEADRAEKNVETWRGMNRSGKLDGYGMGLKETARNERAQAEQAEKELKELMDGNLEILKRIQAEMAAFNGQIRNLPR
jgi:hypothetical protein